MEHTQQQSGQDLDQMIGRTLIEKLFGLGYRFDEEKKLQRFIENNIRCKRIEERIDVWLEKHGKRTLLFSLTKTDVDEQPDLTL